MHHDVIVIGGGPAACAAAVEAARYGREVVLLDPGPEEDGHCAPPGISLDLHMPILTRMLAAGAGQAGGSARCGSPQAVFERAERAASGYGDALRQRVAAAGVPVVTARPRFAAPGELRIEGGEDRTADVIVIATGTSTRRPSSFTFDDVVRDPQSTLGGAGAVRSLLVIGASSEGCELSCLFAALGASVTLVDRRTRLLRSVDRDLLEVLHARLRRDGVDVVLGDDVESIEVQGRPREPHAVVTLGSGRVERCERLSVCAGRVVDLGWLALDRAGIDTDPQGFVRTDEHGQTSSPGIYAVGGVSGIPCELGAELYQARMALRHASGRGPRVEEAVPRMIYTIPEMGTVGLSEEACRRLEIPYRVGRAAYPPPAAWEADGEGAGLLKLVAEAGSGRLLGVHIIGPHARDVLHYGAELLRCETPLSRLDGALFTAPSLCEAYAAAAVDATSRLSASALRRSTHSGAR